MATAPKSGARSANPQAVSGADGAVDAAPAKKSSKKWLFAGLLFALLLGGGGYAAWIFLTPQADVAQAEATAPPPKPPVFMTMDQFTVNLQSDGIEQFLQVAFTLQVPDQTQVDLIKLYMPQVRSRLLLLLSGKRAVEISTPDGKNALAAEIAQQVNEPFVAGLPPQGVSGVFFTSFVIQ
jgi:flagellar FliL protein